VESENVGAVPGLSVAGVVDFEFELDGTLVVVYGDECNRGGEADAGRLFDKIITL
jgi:hypothetical protein